MGLHDLPSVIIGSGWNHLGSRFEDPLKPEVVVRLEGEFDASNSEELLAQLKVLIDDDAVELTLDLSGVGFFSASSIGVIVQLVEKFRLASRRIRLAWPSHEVLRVFGACGLSSTLTSGHLVSVASSTEGTTQPGEDSSRDQAIGSALASWVTVPKAHPIIQRQSNLGQSSLEVPQTRVVEKLCGTRPTKATKSSKTNSVGRGCY